MKRLTLLTGLILICTLLKAQSTHLIGGLDAGVSFGHAPTVGLFVGAKNGSVNLMGGFQCHTTSSVNDGISLQLKGGYDFYVSESISISPYIGYSRRIQSSDRKDLNSSSLLLSGQINHDFYNKWDDRMRVYLSFTSAGKLSILSIGIQGIF